MNMIPFLPVIYQMRVRDVTTIQAIFVNWLQFEAMPQHVIQQHKILHHIRGWRTRECYDAIKSYDWTARIYDGESIVQ